MAETVPMQNTNPYPTVGKVLHFARLFALDADRTMKGYLLSSTQPYMPTLLESAWERLQDDLIDAGVETLTKEAIIQAVPPVGSTDPSVNVYLTWDGFCDGVNAIVETPNLPDDLIIPSDLWERPSGSGGVFSPVTPADGGLPDAYSTMLSVGQWEWRDDKLFMNGANGPMDLKARYVAYLPPIALDGQPINESAKVPIMRCAQAMGYLVASIFAQSRGGVGADKLEASAVREISRITNRTARRKAVVQYRRRSFGR